MQRLKILFLLFAFTLQATGVPTPKELSHKEATEKLMSIAAAIQHYEQQLSSVENELNHARAEENAILNELNQHNQRLMETIHYLRHATQYSPVLAMLSAPKPEDVIHSSMLLRAVTPEIHYRNQQLLQKVTVLSQIRSKLEAKQEELRTITFKYHEERETLDSIINASASSGRIINEIPQGVDENPLLKKPVIGKIIPTYESTKAEWASYTQGILFTTRAEAEVVSPLTGVIELSGDYVQGQGKTIHIRNSTLLVMMSGMRSLYKNCKAGQHIMMGVPIGRMPKEGPKLYLEVWRQEQTIDPQSILKD